MTFGDTSAGFPEAPDTLEEEDKIASLESIALDIDMVLNDMRTANGVSQKMIRPVMHLLPADVKLNSFTQNPTHTNYQIAMESMSAGTAALIGSAVVAVALVFVKIIAWLISLFRGNDKATVVAQKAADEMGATRKVNASIRGILPSDLKAEYETRRDQKMATTFAEMAKLWNPVLRDVLEGGPISRTIGGAEKTFADIIKKMKLMMIVVEREGKKDNGTDHMAASRVMNILNDISFHDDSPAIRSLFIPIIRVGGEVDYQADMRAVNDHMMSLLGQQMQAGFSGEKALDIADNYDFKRCPLNKIDPVKNLEDLESEVKRMEKMTFNKNVGQDVDRTLRATVSSMRKMMDVVRQFYGMAGRMVSQRNRFIELGKTAVSQDNSALVATIVSSDNSEVKNKLRDLNKKR